MAYLNKRGSLFLITLTLLTIVFILGFSFTFFTGSEDYSSSMSFETEVAFNLAESAIEEFVARLKNALNDESKENQLYYVLRSDNVDISKPIPLDALQVANLTAYTRDLARQYYGMEFSRDLANSSDFVVTAVMQLKYINPVEATSGETVLYKIRQDKMEKQAEFTVTADVRYKGHDAKISLTFLVRCVKTFVPPFNYFTLFVRDASVPGGSHFNTWTSSCGKYATSPLRLDHGWGAIKKDWNPVSLGGASEWEKALGEIGNSAPTPPGRLFLGQDLETLYQVGPAMVIRGANGFKLLADSRLSPDPNSNFATQLNCRENAFLRLDVPWTDINTYVDKWVVYQGQVDKEKEASGKSIWHPSTWFGKKYKGPEVDLRVLNIGSGLEINNGTDDAPSYINCFKSFDTYTKRVKMQNSVDDDSKLMYDRLLPDLSVSGFEPFGSIQPAQYASLAPLGKVNFSYFSPTIVYGPAMRQYFRAVQFRKKGVRDSNQWYEFPFVASETFKALNIKENHYMNATEARFLFMNAGVPEQHVEKLIANWDQMPEPLHSWAKYSKFMSDSGSEFFNRSLINILTRIRYKNTVEEYASDMPLYKYSQGYMENDQYPNMPSSIQTAVTNSPMREYYEGLLAYALPDRYSTYLLDFYFIPRATEDLFRGRTTAPIGGVTYDRFEYKYIDNVKEYRDGANFQTLEVNGIVALNDSEPLGLHNNLIYKGNGIIYSSPMMGGGKIVIDGNLLAEDTFQNTKEGKDSELYEYLPSSVGENLLTIIAPQIVIKTDNAPGDRCFIEANLFSLSDGILATGSKPLTIKGTVVTPFLDLSRLPALSRYYYKGANKERPEYLQENVIIYNPLNSIWRDKNHRNKLNSLYVAKIVTGGIGKFEWKYIK